MEPLQHAPDPMHEARIEEALRVLTLPADVHGLHWHPFGIYAVPLAKRTDDAGRRWSRRLHVWHPDAHPVGEASPYGVHTHSGTARSHVLVGELEHHLYEFTPDSDGVWQRAELGKPQGMASLVAHLSGRTKAGMTHTLPKDQPHGVTRPGGFSISLFEQLDGIVEQPFTTWQRRDVPAEELVRKGPVPVGDVCSLAMQALQATA